MKEASSKQQEGTSRAESGEKDSADPRRGTLRGAAPGCGKPEPEGGGALSSLGGGGGESAWLPWS